MQDPEKLREAQALVEELMKEGTRTGAIEGYR
jgi:hypothetical protein